MYYFPKTLNLIYRNQWKIRVSILMTQLCFHTRYETIRFTPVYVAASFALKTKWVILFCLYIHHCPLPSSSQLFLAASSRFRCVKKLAQSKRQDRSNSLDRHLISSTFQLPQTMMITPNHRCRPS